MANWATASLVGDPRQPDWQQKNLTWIEPIPGQRWQVYAPAAKAFEGLLKDLAERGYKPTSSGGFNYRNIRGSDRLSQHAFGTAIDMNSMQNQMGSKVTDIPGASELAKKWGLEWGGNWKGRPDPMHFEYKGGGGDPVMTASAAPPVPGLSTGVGLTSTPPTGAVAPTQVAAAPSSAPAAGQSLFSQLKGGDIKGALASASGNDNLLGGLEGLAGAFGGGGPKQQAPAPAAQPGEALAASVNTDAARMAAAQQMFAALMQKKKMQSPLGLTLGA